MTIPEEIWKRAEHAQVRRERFDRIRSGVIIPANRGVATPMVKDADGKWWPNANFVGEHP